MLLTKLVSSINKMWSFNYRDLCIGNHLATSAIPAPRQITWNQLQCHKAKTRCKFHVLRLFPFVKCVYYIEFLLRWSVIRRYFKYHNGHRRGIQMKSPLTLASATSRHSVDALGNVTYNYLQYHQFWTICDNSLFWETSTIKNRINPSWNIYDTQRGAHTSFINSI